MSSRQTTDLLFQVATPGLSRRAVRVFAKRVAAEVGKGRAFCCLITSDSELRRLNREFRQKDQVTDVLSFPALAGRNPKTPLTDVRGSVDSARYRAARVSKRFYPGLPEPNGFLGEIAISFPTAQSQASEYGLRVNQEIEILMLHGVLHLLGMDHEKDAGRMARAEGKWRTALGLPCGLIERVPS